MLEFFKAAEPFFGQSLQDEHEIEKALVGPEGFNGQNLNPKNNLNRSQSMKVERVMADTNGA